MIGTIRMVLALAMFSLATPPMMLVQAVLLALGRDGRVLPRAWSRLAVRASGARVHIHGTICPERPLLIAANHISWIDIAVLGAIAPVHFIAKSEVRDWPVFGVFARLQRSVFVQRERRGMSQKQAHEIAARLDRGDPMVLFAEGSTSDGNFLLPFKSTLFGAAHMVVSDAGRESVHIQPVAIAYTRFHGMPMGRQHRGHAAWIGDRVLAPHVVSVLREAAIDVDVYFGEPVEYRADSNRKTVTREVEARVHHMFTAALRGKTADEILGETHAK